MKKISFTVYSDSGFTTEVILFDKSGNDDSFIKQSIVRRYVEDGFFIKDIRIEDLKSENSSYI